MSTEKIEKLHVPLGDASYDIFIGNQALQDIDKYLPFDMEGVNAFVVTDENIKGLYADKVCSAIKSSGVANVNDLVLPAGESTKSFEHLQNIVDWLLDNNVNRQSVLFALGGGVIGDIGGFAAL